MGWHTHIEAHSTGAVECAATGPCAMCAWWTSWGLGDGECSGLAYCGKQL
eukprot:m.50106 g.50106  ORF g.50106 m.50106 type:complete len:50 (+) comp16267_c0_seq1:286-435(+)